MCRDTIEKRLCSRSVSLASARCGAVYRFLELPQDVWISERSVLKLSFVTKMKSPLVPLMVAGSLLQGVNKAQSGLIYLLPAPKLAYYFLAPFQPILYPQRGTREAVQLHLKQHGFAADCSMVAWVSQHLHWVSQLTRPAKH